MRHVLLVAVATVALAWPGETIAQPPFAIGQVHYGGGGDWYSSTSSIANGLREVRVRLGMPTEDQARTVRLTDRDAYRTPLLYINGHGNMRLTEMEAQSLRRHLTGGGFLFVNDDYGLAESFRREIAKVFPDASLVALPSTHLIYHSFYDLPGLPKIHEHDGDPAQGYGIYHGGRLVVFYAWSSDIGDGLEDFSVHKDPVRVREAAIRMAVNIVSYVLTH